MKRRALLGLLVAGGTTGCLRLEGGGGTTGVTRTTGGATEADDTATDTPTVDATTESEPDTATERADPTYPFGLSEDGVEPYLYSTCQSAVSELSYRVQYTKVDSESGTQRWHREYEAEGGAALGHWTRKSGGAVDAFHPVSGDMLWREAVGDGDYTFGLSRRSSFQEVFWSEELQPLLKGPAWGPPERVNDDRPAIWELTAESVGETVRSPGHMDGELKRVEGARLRVDENGVIRRIETVYESTDFEGNRRRYRFEFRVADVGSVTLTAPSWVDRAQERRPKLKAQLTDDRKYVRLTVDSGSIATGSRISVFDHGDSDRKYVVYTDREVSSGDVLYLHALTDTGKFNDAGIGYGERAAVGTPPTLESTYHVVAFRRDTKYGPGVDVTPPS
jgi:hypothetical protein